MNPTAKAKAATIAAVLAFASLASSSSFAQDKPGRYVMNPVEGGFARLDTETGAMSICKPQSKDAAAPANWACTPMVDEAAAQQEQTRKLEAQNNELKAEVKRMEDLLGLNGEKPKEPEMRAERPRQEFKLPSEQDVDKALSYFESMVKKFHDSMKRLEGKLGEKSDI
jgi:hypothetical protein